MKKLVSAATSLVMAATMVGAVAPVVAGAVDATKGLTIQAYKDATLPEGVTDNGSTILVSADAVKAGDVKVPVAIYLNEETADLATIACDATVKSDNDAEAHKIKFEAYQPGVKSYFDSAKEFTFADGTTFTTDMVVSFAGKYGKRTGYEAHGSYNVACAESQSEAGTNNAFVGVSWTAGTTKYKWAGEASDTFPIVVFDVTLPKGLAEGEYVIDYCNYMTKYENPSCLLETSVKYDAMDRNNLTLNNLTIKVGDAGSAQTTTSATTASAGQTTTVTTASSSATSASSGSGVNVGDADLVLDFINPDSEDGYWRVDPDDGVVYVDAHLTAKDDTVKPTGFGIDFSVEGGFTVEFEGVSPALDRTQMTLNTKTLTVAGNCAQQDGHGTVVNKEDNVMVMMTLTVPDGIKDGLYEITSTRAFITKDSKLEDGEAWDVAIVPGYIAIGDVSTPQTTTAATTASTAATTTTTATTAKSTGSTGSSATTASTGSSGSGANTGTPNYGDTNCDGYVRINDVVLLNKYLNDNKSYAISDQGKLNADCYNPKKGEELTAEDSDAIIKSIVHLVTLPVNK